MHLTDYEETAATVDFTPRPNASQAVAAAHRAAQHDVPANDDRPTIEPAPLSRQHMLLAIVGVVAVVGVLALAVSQLSGATGKPLQIAPAATEPARMFQTAPTAAPVPTSEATPIVATIGAYAAPDGLLLGQIDMATEHAFPVARYGNAWVQLQRTDATKIWVRLADVPVEQQSFAALPDLAPVAQTGRGLTLDPVTPTDPPPPPEPTAAPAPPTATTVWPTSAPATAPDFKKPDITGTCKLIGCLGQNAVDLVRAQDCHALYWQYGDADPESIAEPDYSAVRGCIWEGLYK